MILHRQGKWMIAQSHLLDDLIARAPRFHYATFGRVFNRLMMRAVYVFETMRSGAIVAQRLNVVVLLFRRIVPFDIELKRSAQRDVEELHAFADGEDGKATIKRILHSGKFPFVARWIDIFFQN